MSSGVVGKRRQRTHRKAGCNDQFPNKHRVLEVSARARQSWRSYITIRRPVTSANGDGMASLSVAANPGA